MITNNPEEEYNKMPRKIVKRLQMTRAQQREAAELLWTDDEILEHMPRFPSMDEYIAKSAMTCDTFLASVGEINFDFSKENFRGTTGGEPNDSLRGFGPTDQFWRFSTANGWSISYNGIYTFAGDITSGTSPEGITWIRISVSSGDPFTRRDYFVEEFVYQDYVARVEKAREARENYKKKWFSRWKGRRNLNADKFSVNFARS